MPRSLTAILAISFALKCALLIPAHLTRPFADSADYVRAAVGLTKRGEYRSLRAPGYPFALAGAFWVAGRLGYPVPTTPGAADDMTAFDVARGLQVVVSTATVFLLYLLTLQFFDRRAAVAAAAIMAFYPVVLAYSHLLWSETLFLLLLISGVLLVGRAALSLHLATAFAGGMVLGLGALTRQVGLVVVAIAASWIWIDVATEYLRRGASPPPPNRGSRYRIATGLALAVAVGAATTVLPWTARNLARHGELILISASGGSGLLFGATDDPMTEIGSFNDPSLRLDMLRRDRLAGERAKEIIAADPFAWVVRCATHNLPSLFQPLGTVMLHVIIPTVGYGNPPRWLKLTAMHVLRAAYVGLVVAAICGAWLCGERRFTWFFVGLVAAFVASHTVVLGVSRHRLPLELMAMPLAGFLVTRTGSELRRASTPRRLAGIACCLSLFALLVGLSDVPGPIQIWRQGGRISRPG